MTPMAAALACALLGAPADWTGWRGPEGDGRARGFTVPGRWPEALREEWRVEVGEGHSSPLAAEGRVYLLSREGDQETARALDLETGKVLWKEGYPAPYQVDPAAASHGKGPKSTPALRDGRLFTLGISGILSAFDARQGKLLWRKEFTGEFPRSSPLYGTAASPLVDGETLIAQVGGHERGAIRAFDVRSGEPRWSWTSEGPGYATPVVVELAGERQVVVETQRRLVGVSTREGKLLWELPFRTPYDQNVITVLPHRDLLIHSGLEQPLRALRLARRPPGEAGEGQGGLEAREAWSNAEVPLYMSSPVVEGDLLFGLSHRKKGQLFCLQASTGQLHWKDGGGRGDNAALVSLGPALAVLTTGGELLLVKAEARGPEVLARYRVSSNATWAHPAFVGGRVLVKDQSSLASFRIAAD